MTVKLLQKGFNFSQDGPGNRLVYHLQGCNFRCPWCSNPESFSADGSIMTVGGRERLSCEEVEVSDILDEVGRSRMMFFDGGGVTFTGGEPTVQFDALRELLLGLKSMGIRTAVETNGSHPKLPELFELIDFLIMDVKHYDADKHREAIGADNAVTLANLRAASERRSQLLVRIPLIGGFNASPDDAEGFARLFEEYCASFVRFEPLRYHEFGKDKWAQCGMKYTVKDAKVSMDEYKNFIDILNKNSLTTVRT